MPVATMITEQQQQDQQHHHLRRGARRTVALTMVGPQRRRACAREDVAVPGAVDAAPLALALALALAGSRWWAALSWAMFTGAAAAVEGVLEGGCRVKVTCTVMLVTTAATTGMTLGISARVRVSSDDGNNL